MKTIFTVLPLAITLAFPAFAEGWKEPVQQPQYNGQQSQNQSGVVTGHQSQHGTVTGTNTSNNRNDNRANANNRSTNQNSSQVGNIDVSNTNRQAASGAYSANINGCGAAGGFSAGMQALTWGVTAARCKEDRFQQVIIAEERFKAGSPAAAAYLAQVSGPARRAMVDAGMVRDHSRQRASSTATVEIGRDVSFSRCNMHNGQIYFSTKPRHDRNIAREQCVQMLTPSAGPATPVHAQSSIACPAGSTWDGKGCWTGRK